jgi:hypothetical protein
MTQRVLARQPAPASAAPLRASSSLRVNKPGDTFEQEADRVADAVISGGHLPAWSFARVNMGAVQRDTPDDPSAQQQPKPNNYGEAAQKVLEAAMQTDAGKKVIQKVENDPLVKDAKDFVTSTPGMIVAGTAAAGVVAGLTAAHKPLPVQLPAVPVDKVVPALKGVKAQISVQGPLDRPTQITIGFGGTFGGGATQKHKKDDTSAQIAKETQALRASMDMFKPKGQAGSEDVGELLRLGKGAATPGFSIEDFGARRFPTPLPGTQGAPLAPVQQPANAPAASAADKDPQAKKEDEVPIQRKEDNNAPLLQRECSSCGGSDGQCDTCKGKREEPMLQRKHSEPVAASAPSSVANVLQSSGSPLEGETRSFFASRFGVDFSKVRIHTDAQAASSAADVAARAYTVENRIVFNSGQYSPYTQGGRKLLAHELTHVVQQTRGLGTGRKSPRAVQRKVILKHTEMGKKERQAFLGAHKHDWPNETKASQMMEEMAAAGDSFDFADDDELKTEIVKRISTVQHMEESQPPAGKIPAHLKTAFGYPFNPPADIYGPRVNYAAKDYWEPGVPDDYAERKDAAKIKLARSLPRSERHTVWGDQKKPYSWKLTEKKGKADPYTAIKLLFVPQAPHQRTLFHCDYLISVVNFMSLADSIGKDEFNKRIAAFGVDKILLNWNAFTDLHAETALRDPRGEFTSTASQGLKSTQRVKPSTEKDLVIGDHVVFSNHLAYDLLNYKQGHAWRLENAVFVSRHSGQNVYLGHGSGYKTDSQMRSTLAHAFNDVVVIAKPLIAKAKSHDPKVKAAGEQDLKVQFPLPGAVPAQSVIQHVGNEFHAVGKGRCDKDIDFNVHDITKDEVIGLHDPCNPADMYPVERPIESAPGKATP